MTTLSVIGAGGHGAVIAETAEEAGHWSRIVFLDETSTGIVAGFPIAGDLSEVARDATQDWEFVVAIGENGRRLEVLADLSTRNRRVVSVIHPSAVVSRSAIVEEGVVIFAQAVLNARAKVQRAAIINTAATVDHDCSIGEGAHISPGAHLAGNVHVGKRSWIGIGASIRQGISVGHDAIVGAGAAVVRDVPRGATVVGIPARPLPER